MANYLNTRRINRRDFLKLGGGVAVGLTSASLLSGPALARNLLQPAGIIPGRGPAHRAPLATQPYDVHLVGTDGWAYLPGPPISPWHPDPWAPALFTTYVFGFRDVTNMTTGDQVQAQKGRAQIVAPPLIAAENVEFRVKLSNPGLLQRPDLFDSHTFHWHGFRDAIPAFDGEPIGSFSVPIGRSFTYYFMPRWPGTYLYHCHFEDSEHVHMGMTGTVFVRPLQNGNPLPSSKYVYNDGVLPDSDPRSTRYDREYVIMLTDVWAQMHYDDAHIQLIDWSDFRPDFWLMNGRCYPDTLAPNGGGPDLAADGDLIPPLGRPELQYQPVSSLIRANAGDRVLLRFCNLSYQEHSMTLTGIPMRVVGKDATYLRGRDGTDLTYSTNCITFAAGETTDAIFVAPPVASRTTYLLYNRNYDRLTDGGPGFGGQMTEIQIRPTGDPQPFPAQTVPITGVGIFE